MKKEFKIILFSLVALLVLFIGFESNAYQEYKNEQELLNTLESSEFIEVDKNTKEVKVLRDKISNESLTKNFPRKRKIRKSIFYSPENYFKDLDTLGQFNLDEKFYIVGKYYLYSNDKTDADKYIDFLEDNVNEKKE